MKKFFKVGVIGVGNIAQTFHIPAWVSNKKIIIESIADINLKNLNKVKKNIK